MEGRAGLGIWRSVLRWVVFHEERLKLDWSYQVGLMYCMISSNAVCTVWWSLMMLEMSVDMSVWILLFRLVIF